MAIQLQRSETNVVRIVDSIIQLVQGRSNATGELILATGVTTTVVIAVNCSRDSQVLLSPRTANAAAAIPTTYISAVNQGSFTVTHANDASTDRRFGYVALGG